MRQKISLLGFNSALGQFWIAATEGGLCRVSLKAGNEDEKTSRQRMLVALERRFGAVEILPDYSALAPAVRYLERYIATPLKAGRYDRPLDPGGTDFQRRIWDVLLGIPAGSTRSYGEVAALAGSPLGARAAGAACGANPLLIIVPCHRVIGSDRSLTGFGGGLELKRKLLDAEKAQFAVS